MRKYRGFSMAWWIVLLHTLIMISFSCVKSYLFPFMSDNLFSFISQLSMIIPIGIGISVLKLYHPYDTVKNMLAVREFDILILVPLIILPLCASSFISIVAAPFNNIIYEIFGSYEPGISSPSSLSDFFYQLFSLCIAAPILEELFFRGVLLKLFDRYGTVTAIIMSSLAFSFMHFDPTGFFTIFLLGVLICILRLGTGSIFSGMVFHSANNYFSLISLIFKNAVVLSEKDMITFSICSAIAFPLIMLPLIKFSFEKFYFEGTGEKNGFSFAFTIMIIIYILTCISNNLFI